MQFPARIIAVYMILLARIDGMHLLVKVDGQMSEATRGRHDTLNTLLTRESGLMEHSSVAERQPYKLRVASSILAVPITLPVVKLA